MLIYLISLLFACESSFLGFELDLLTHEFLVSFVCRISTLRNPWYSYFSLIYFSYIDSCSFFSICSYPEILVIAPDTPDLKTRSIRAESASDSFKCLWVADCLFTTPSRHLKVLSGLPCLIHAGLGLSWVVLLQFLGYTWPNWVWIDALIFSTILCRDKVCLQTAYYLKNTTCIF